MKLTDASKELKNLLKETTRKSERKVYQALLGVVSNLGERELSEEEQRSLEEAMDRLNLPAGSGTPLKILKRSRNRFMKFLKEELSLIPQGYYTELGMVFGLMAGTALAPLIENTIGSSMGLSMGISLGICLGLIVGQRMDKDAEKQNRVLATQ